MHFKQGLRDWRGGYTTIYTQTSGIELVVGMILYSMVLTSFTQWLHMGFGNEQNKSVSRSIDLYVVGVLVASIFFFLCPSTTTAWLSTYISVSTLIVLLNIVLLQRIFGEIPTPERSLLLFICNVTQIVFMFATWYHLGGETAPLLKSVLAFATIGYSESMPRTAMVQIATDFVLLAVYLSHLVGRFGGRANTAQPAKPVAL